MNKPPDKDAGENMDYDINDMIAGYIELVKMIVEGKREKSNKARCITFYVEKIFCVV